jgi:hypothetical protein
LIRAKKNNRWRVIEELGTGDQIVELNVSGVARTRAWPMRAIS